MLSRAKTVLQEGLTRAKTVSSSYSTRLRVPPLARWTVRERVRTSGYSCMCAAPCHPWHRGISPSMDKSCGALRGREPSALALARLH
ncbi:hypothetical protein Desor_5013 [Desulfosporosinus orientis DSM 765]|uniref:Uncharacterized protein n=1 Tax=Desulfosporosinus orientis (strain ATCC 19365 / DSM 765 / NCIMB 8382 / VKM B-1628 / Singapore I) TaxID=768706 RepID=G7WJG9_DESOD|nr:hypothetical protein Desor_5013 [Desulfosporosinus orientis DSM 765]